MSSPIKIILPSALAAGVAIVCLWLLMGAKGEVRSLQGQMAILNQSVADLESEKDELAKNQLSPTERDRIDRDRQELIRLRGDVMRLRQQLDAKKQGEALAKRQEAAAKAAAANSTSEAVAEGQVQEWMAEVTQVIQADEALVMGGWDVGNGRRTFIVATPRLLGAAQEGQVATIQVDTQMITLQDDQLPDLGLDGLRAKGSSSQIAGLMDLDNRKALFELAGQLGAELKSGPRVAAISGQEASISQTAPYQLPDGESVELGPSYTLVASEEADGAVRLEMSAVLRALSE